MPPLTKKSLSGGKRHLLKRQRKILISLLCICLFAPVLFFHNKINDSLSLLVRQDFDDELKNDIIVRTDTHILNIFDEDKHVDVTEPKRVIYEQGDHLKQLLDKRLNILDEHERFVHKEENHSIVHKKLDGTASLGGVSGSRNVREIRDPIHKQEVKEPKQNIYKKEDYTNPLPEKRLQESHGRGDGSHKVRVDLPAKPGKQHFERPPKGKNRRKVVISREPTDEKLRLIRDQVIRAKVYLNCSPRGTNAQLVKELRSQIRRIERVAGEAKSDLDLNIKRAMRRIRAMDTTLSKAARVFQNCTSLANCYEAMVYNSEEEVRVEIKHALYLTKLAADTLPKGIQCLAMHLTANFFALDHDQREIPNKEKLLQPGLYHYVVFSENILTCAVVVNSTISTSTNPGKIVFHVVTDALNYPAMVMWFLANPPDKATIEILSIDDPKWLPPKARSLLQHLDTEYISSFLSKNGPRYISLLNHMRLFLPDLFPKLDRIVLLDHDVVVQRDLSELWSFDMQGKAIGAVETCTESRHYLRMFVDSSDPFMLNSFSDNVCSWDLGMNVINLQEWRRHNLTEGYHKWHELVWVDQLLKLRSVGVEFVAFHNLSAVLSKNWLVVGLGYDADKNISEIEHAAVIHYDGYLKPWLQIGIPKFRRYWSKFLSYDHPYLKRCNIRG